MKIGNTNITPRLGQMVLYTLSDSDARQVLERRLYAGRSARSGNEVREGDTYPAMIVRDWANSIPETRQKYRDGEITDGAGRVITLEEMVDNASVNLQVFLDGDDTLWVTSRSKFNPELHGRWFEVDDDSNSLFTGGKSFAEMLEAGHRFEPDPLGHWTDLVTDW